VKQRTLIAALSLGGAVILYLSTLMGGLLAWGLRTAVVVILIAVIIAVSKLTLDTKANRRMPSSLTSTGFAYEQPQWLTDAQRKSMSDLAKAAFVLLLFEQTETGCWGKSYLPRPLARGEALPLAQGAITGTPFALLAISSYAERRKSETGAFCRVERLVHEPTNYAVLQTLAGLLQPDGSYLKGYRESYPGTDKIPESSRHEAGACLIRLLYGGFADRDLRTIERLCAPMTDPKTYDFAVVSRLFLQVPYTDSIPLLLRLRVALRRKKLLAKLVFEIQSAAGADLAGQAGMRHESINQWSTAWYILPMLTLPKVSSALRGILTGRMRQFFSARSAAALTGTSLLPPEVGESGRGVGNSAFGSGVALLLWRTLERIEPNDERQSKQAQNMVDRMLESASDAIEAPMFNPNPETPEGYLGWGAICLGAASVGIRISHDDCAAAVTLTKQLNDESVDNRSEEKLASAYLDIINKNRLLSPELAGHVARAAARLSIIYEPVKRAKKEAVGSRV
jgi:hypothetical protein